MKELRVVGCFLQDNEKFLLLLKHPNHFESNTWTLPCGKVENKENDLQAMIRELKEETSLSVKEDDLTFVKEFIHEENNRRVVFLTFKMN